MIENSRAAIIGGRDDHAGAGRIGGGEHGVGNFLRRTKRDGADRGTGAAQECTKRAGGFGGADDVIEKRDQFFPERLVKMIDERAVERLVFTRGERSGDGAGVSRIFHGMQTIDPERKEPASCSGGDFEIGHEKDEM